MDGFQKLVTRALEKKPASAHPDPDLLTAFAENALSRNEQASLLEHLSSCSDCRQILYLASPLDQVQTVTQVEPRRFPVLIRWGTVAASVAILAIVFGARYIAHKQAGPAPVLMAAKQPPRELDRLPEANQVTVNRDEDQRTRNPRPAEKHMTARPEAKLRFDESGQVHVTAPAAAPSRQALSAPGRKKEDVAEAKSLSDKPSADSDLAANAIKSTNESVAVSGSAVHERVVKDGELKRVPAAQNAPSAGDAAVSAMGKVASLPQWRLARQGGIERSADSGKTWIPVSVAHGAVLKALFVNGASVWAGGKNGVLFHSQNGGADWVQVQPEFAGQKLAGDITQINFSDAMNGALYTESSETWITSDGGNSWLLK